MHTQPVTLHASSNALASARRPDISVYWRPGCSMCLKAKEFVEEQGLDFESLNVMERNDAMDELTSSGLRGLPVVRKGDQLIYAQSMEDIAEFLGTTGASGTQPRLSRKELLQRWDRILEHAQEIVSSFNDEQLERRAILIRDRPIKVLSSHVFQIAEAFMKAIDEGLTDTRELQGRARLDIVTRSDLVAYTRRILATYRDWLARGRQQAIPDYIVTFYGRQPADVVIERFVWHSTQHARQLDIVAAGMGAELQIPPELYAGLPLPRRLWA